MFSYVGDLSTLAHDIIEKYCKNKELALDATLGNGHDTDFLREHFNKVVAMDIQQKLIDDYKKKKGDEGVSLYCLSHDAVDTIIHEKIDCAIYNLGYCPGGDIGSLRKVLELLNPGGIITIGIYVGHNEGKNEETFIMKYLENLPKKQYGVMVHQYINRSLLSPKLIVIEKNDLK